MKRTKFFIKVIYNGEWYLKNVNGYLFNEDTRLFIHPKSKDNPFNCYALVDIKTGAIVCTGSTKKELLKKFYDNIKIKYDNINEYLYNRQVLKFNELLISGKILEVEEE